VGTGKDLWTELEALSNKQDWTGVASLYTSDAVYSTPNFRHEGREAILAFLEAGDKTFPDETTQTSLVIEEGDIVVAEWDFRGTNTGPITTPDGTEIPATGKSVELPGVTVAEVRDGKIAVAREYFDSAVMSSQLGLMGGT
jgi:steroid delta-isomerase-like uncharacterized protein